MKEITVDVIIPVYRPGERFGELLKRLDAQTQPVNRYIIMNTEQAYWDRWLSETGYSLPENLSVFHVTRETFDHWSHQGRRDPAVGCRDLCRV